MFYELLTVGDRSVRFLAENLIEAARKPLDETPLLEELISGGGGSRASGDGKGAAPAVAEAPGATPAPSPAGPALSEPGGEPEPRRRVITSFWVALAGAVTLLGLLVGMMALVANKGASDPRKEPPVARGDTPGAEKSPPIPREESPPDKKREEEPEPKPPELAPESRIPPEPGPKQPEPLPEPLKTPAPERKPPEPEPAPRKPTAPVDEIRRFVGHSGAAFSVAFAPNGRTAVSGGYDKTVRLWDVESGQEIHRFEGHTDLITGVCFTPKGHHILSWSDDKPYALTGRTVAICRSGR